MKAIMRPTSGPDDWRDLLAEPEKHWRAGYSAHALAHCWEAGPGFPSRVSQVPATNARFRNLELLLGIPEYQVPLPGGVRPSQTDLWLLARAADGLVSVAVEGKVSEPFGPTLSEWQRNGSAGKAERLAHLLDLLHVPAPSAPELRYQLFHRTASAILLAQRFQARDAVMLVHSFSPTHEWFEDYLAFAEALGSSGALDHLVDVPGHATPSLSLAWVSDVVADG